MTLTPVGPEEVAWFDGLPAEALEEQSLPALEETLQSDPARTLDLLTYS